MKSLVLLLLLGGCSRPEAQPVPRESVPPDAPVPVLVELFTSEGCSSCPAADGVARAVATEPPPGTRVVALELHVDYWNQLGHVDRFSAPAFTQRQADYQAHFGDRGSYTPEAVVDGLRGLVGSNEPALREAIAVAARRPHATVELTEAAVQIGALPSSVHDAHLFVAEVDEAPATRVTRGENAGRTLQHHWVVTQLTDAGPVPGVGGTFALPARRAPRVAFVSSPDGVVGSASRN